MESNERRKVFQSSNLHSGSYNRSNRTMTLTYGNGDEYDYLVPPELWDKLKAAERPGQFYHQNIKPNFPIYAKRRKER